MEGWRGLWFACNSTSGSTVGRVHNSLPFSVSTIVVLERGPYSCLVMMKKKMKHTHTCYSQARVRTNERFESCYCHQVFLSSNPKLLHFPWNGFSLVVRVHRRQLGLALVRHNAAAQLDGAVATSPEEETPGEAMDEQYTQALCDWVATLEALAASEAARQVAPRDVAFRWKECTDRWRRGCRSSLRSRSGHTASHHEI